jgi:hypothetical protein
MDASASTIGPGIDAGPGRPGWLGFALGVAEALGIIALFVAGGVFWAGQLVAGSHPGSSADPALYVPAVYEPASPPPTAPPPPRLWLVDGYNLLHVALLAGQPREAWWSGERRREVLERVAGFEEPDASIWVVFDGPDPSDAAPDARVREVFAPSADDFLLRQIPADTAGEVALVTADRRLAARARQRGAQVVSPAAFLARCRRLG